MKKSILPVFPILVLFMLLLFPGLSFEGAKNGLLLWFNVVLPTLLPFMLCSSLIVAWGGVPYMMKPLSPLFSRFHLSEAGGYTWICGLLCGYPMGAKTAADFVRDRKMSVAEGTRMLAIAACPSPMFLTGYVKFCLPKSVPLWQIILSVYAPVLLIAVLSGFIYHPEKSLNLPAVRSSRTSSETDRIRDGKTSPPAVRKPFDDILMDSLEIMVKIGGYIIMFSILAVYARHFLPADFTAAPVLLGMIEMTTGIEAISGTMTGTARTAAILSSAAFGGLSGVFQTKSVIKNAGLPIRHYVAWKLLHAGLTCIVFILLFPV